MYAAPAVAGEQVLIGSCAGKFLSLDRNTGRKNWECDLPKVQFHGNPIILDSSVVVGTDSNLCDSMRTGLIALDLRTGAVLWEYLSREMTTLGCGFTADLVRFSDLIIGVNVRDDIFAMESADGNVHWHVESNTPKDSAGWVSGPALSDTTLIHGDLAGAVTAYDVKSGRQLWRTLIGGRIVTPVSIYGRSCYFATSAHELWRVNLSDGSPEGMYKLQDLPHGRPLMVENSIILFVNWGMEDAGSQIVAVDTALRNTNWEVTADDGSAWSVKEAILFNDGILAGDTKGNLKLLSAIDGGELWSIELGGRVRSLTADHEVLFIGLIEGTVFAIRVDQGR